MKKLISTLLLIIVLFNFILNSGKSYADTDESVFGGEDTIKDESFSASEMESGINNGTVINPMTGKKTSLVWDILGKGFTGLIAGILGEILRIFPDIVRFCMACMVDDDYIKDGFNAWSMLTDEDFRHEHMEGYTIENTVFGKYNLFNINYFDFSNEATNDLTKALKESVAKFYIILRLISIAMSLVILIYVGIRMALSTVTSDKVKYKKMFIGWLESIILLFIMQYIISIMFTVGDAVNSMMSTARDTLVSNDAKSFEKVTILKIHSFLVLTNGWKYFLYVVIYWILMYIQTKFFVMYFRRKIVVGFLILISPLITITYPIDKIGDGKAQAFTVWVHEMLINVFIQPIQALIYLIFMYTAGAIAENSTLIALLFLWNLTKIDRIILHLFNLRNMISMRPVDEERKKRI